MPIACMNDTDSRITKAWLAAAERSPMRAVTVEKTANDSMPITH